MGAVNPVSLDIVWVLVATVLVFLMQAGFALLESGAARAKNSINIIMKNVIGYVDWFSRILASGLRINVRSK